jgi:antitoxin component YwqK of YwqJK toxin-antitoxin module
VAEMKKLIFLLIFPLLFFVSCQSKLTEEIIEKHPDGTPKLVRYYSIDGQVKELAKEIQYYPNHNKFYEGEFKNNRKNGSWTVWYQNGNIWSEGFYDNGLDDGKRTGYYETGKKHFEGRYKKGKMTGTWKFWDEKGVLANEIDYDK